MKAVSVLTLLSALLFPIGVWSEPLPSEELDEKDWLMEAEALSPGQQAARIEKALATYGRENASFLLGALLSQHEEVKPWLPAIQRRLHLLVQPGDVEALARKVKEIGDPQRRDWLVDLMGFCGESSFEKLKQWHQEGAEERLRIGALRAMTHTMSAEALSYVAEAAARSGHRAEREAARFAEACLRWQTGRLKPGDRERAPRPLVRVKAGAESIRQALERGGTLLVEASELVEPVQAILKDFGVQTPLQGEKAVSQNCVFSVADFHPLLAYPLDFFHADVAAGTFAEYGWGEWQPGQSTPLRLSEKPKLAPIVIQENVLGKGRVIFSGLSAHNWSQTAARGVAERDPWEENLEWFHANRDLSTYLHVWRATDAWVSQHVPWGKPLDGGPVRAAILTADCNGRDPVEYAQRLEMDFEHLPYAWAASKGTAFKIEVGRLTPLSWEIIERVLASPREVIVLSAHGLPSIPQVGPRSFSVLPVAYQQFLLRLVRDKGLGLVLIGEAGPLEKLPENRVEETLSTPWGQVRRAEWGKGRIVGLERLRGVPRDYETAGAFHPVARVNPFDHWAQEAVQQIAWAARRQPPLHIVSLPVLGADSAQVTVRNQGSQPLDGKLGLELRNRFDRIAVRGERKLQVAAGQETTLSIPVEAIPAGHFFAELIGRDGQGKSLGWAVFPVHVSGAVEITGMEFSQPLYRPGEEMALRLGLQGQTPPDAVAETEVLDSYGRLCGRSSGPLDAADPSCRVRIGQPLWRYVVVRVWIRENEKILSYGERPWIVDVPPPRKDFPYAAWSSTLALPPLLPGVHQAGVDWLNGDYEECLRSGFRPWVLGFGGIGLGEHAQAMNGERNPNPVGPTFHQWRVNSIPGQVPGLMRADVPAIVDQDEESLGGEYGFDPASLHEFRKHLQLVHDSLDRLNEVWQTSFKAWADVRPMRLAGVQGRASLAPMVEIRMFMDTAYLHHVEFDRFVLESCGMPDVKLGLSTSGGGFADGWDIWKASKMLTCMIEQHTGNREKFRSWRRPDMVLGRWTGGYYPDCVPSGRFMPWHQLLHEKTVYATWDSGIGTDMSLWRSDGGVRDGIAAATEELREIWSGPATLIRHSLRPPPQIGIHYSRASQMASAAEGTWVAWSAAQTIEDTLEMLGHQYRYISYEEIEQGFCDQWPGRCLFLPASICLSQLEADAVRRFVERGGTVVADGDAGTRDGHGGPAGRGQLTDVFGCEWIPAPKLAKEQKIRLELHIEGIAGDLELNESSCRLAKLTTGKALGSLRYGDETFPAWIQHGFGKGNAVTLNFLPGQTKAARTILSALLAEAGVTHPVGVSRDGEHEMLAVERFRFLAGASSFTGLIHFVKMRSGWGRLHLTPEEQKPIPDVMVTFPVNAHLYDVRAGRYLGQTDRLRMPLLPGRGYLFAHLPYLVKGIEITFPETTSVKGTGTIDVRVDAGDAVPEGHALHVQVFDPTGRERTEYGGVFYSPDGKGRFEVPLAPNDPPGRWRVMATDAATRVAAVKEWEVGE